MPTETAIRQDSAAGFRHGDMVTVRSLEEILATLDADAKFEGLPFMPEMAPYCGRTFKVFRRADKTCVEGIGIRSMRDTVFLEGLRCNGSLHDGCQRGCLFFWKNAWLKAADRVPTDSQFSPAEGQERSVRHGDDCPPPHHQGRPLLLPIDRAGRRDDRNATR